jgi:hypothetical protein
MIAVTIFIVSAFPLLLVSLPGLVAGARLARVAHNATRRPHRTHRTPRANVAGSADFDRNV